MGDGEQRGCQILFIKGVYVCETAAEQRSVLRTHNLLFGYQPTTCKHCQHTMPRTLIAKAKVKFSLIELLGQTNHIWMKCAFLISDIHTNISHYYFFIL